VEGLNLQFDDDHSIGSFMALALLAPARQAMAVLFFIDEKEMGFPDLLAFNTTRRRFFGYQSFHHWQISSSTFSTFFPA
jgi:hypothetical protein